MGSGGAVVVRGQRLRRFYHRRRRQGRRSLWVVPTLAEVLPPRVAALSGSKPKLAEVLPLRVAARTPKVWSTGRLSTGACRPVIVVEQAPTQRHEAVLGHSLCRVRLRVPIRSVSTWVADASSNGPRLCGPSKLDRTWFELLCSVFGSLCFSSLLPSLSPEILQHYLRQNDKLTKLACCAALGG